MWRGRLQPTLRGSKTLGGTLAHLHVCWRQLQKLWLVICSCPRHRNQTIRSTFMQFHDAFNSKSISCWPVTQTYSEKKSHLYSEHNDLRLYLVAVKLTVGFCQDKPYKTNPIKKYAACSAPRKKNKSRYGYEKGWFMPGIWLIPVLGSVGSHGGKDAVAFLLKTVLLQKIKGG